MTSAFLRRLRAATLVTGLLLYGTAVGGMPGENPFARPGPAIPAAPASPPDRVELAGAMTLDGRTLVCIASTDTKRTRWLPVGTESEGMSALEFDPAVPAVLVRSGGTTSWVRMRKATITPLTLQRTSDGSIDWEHMRLSDRQKEQKAEAMVANLLEAGFRAQSRRLEKPESPDGAP